MRTLRPLTNEEKYGLEAALKQTRDLFEWKRVFVILRYDEGQSIDELARLLCISKWTVEQYLKEYSSQNKTKNDPRGGSNPKLTPEESQQLENQLSRITYLKVRPVIDYVQKQFGKTYSRSGMTLWLKERGFVYKRPQKVPGKLNPEDQEKFIQEYEKLKASFSPDEELYFVDAVHPEYQSQAVCGWIKKGECKTLQTTGKQLRLHFAGALRLEGMKLIVKEYETVDAEAILDLFSEVERESPARVIHIVLDNAKAHKNKKLEEYLKNSRIKLHYLPPYSPNLNSIERLWKLLRELTLYNRYFATCKEFFAAVRGFFTETIPKISDLLARRITDKFQVIKLNPIDVG
jgi:transposase